MPGTGLATGHGVNGHGTGPGSWCERAQDWPRVMVRTGTGLALGHGANGHRTGHGSWCERAQDRPRVMARTGTGLATGHSMNGPMTVATDWATVRWSHQLGFVVQSSVMFVLHCLLQ